MPNALNARSSVKVSGALWIKFIKFINKLLINWWFIIFKIYSTHQGICFCFLFG